MDKEINIKPYLDEEGRVTQLPRKQAQRLAVLAYLAEKFELGRDYREREVNALCDSITTMNDCFLVRRELTDSGLIKRERDGSRYWREAAKDTAE